MSNQKSGAQLAAEEIRQISDTTRHKDYMAKVEAIIEKHCPSTERAAELQRELSLVADENQRLCREIQLITAPHEAEERVTNKPKSVA